MPRSRCGTVAARSPAPVGRRPPAPSARPWTRWASPRSTRRRSWVRRPRAGATVFGLDYFGRPAFLAQSPQFYKQLMVGVFERVYEVGPVFRAEPHDTTRHLAEYTSLDAEMGFIDDHRDVMKVLREVMAGIMPAISRDRGAGGDPGASTSSDALKIAGANPEEPDLAPADERAIGEWAQAGARERIRLRHRLPDGQTPVLHAPGPGAARLLQRFRPALPGARAGHRRAAAAPLRGLRRRA